MRPALALCLLLALPSRAGANPDEQIEASARMRIGSITAPFYTDAQPIVRSELQAYTWTFEGRARLYPTWWLGAVLPIATSSVEEPAGSYVADYTLGNPLAYVEHDPGWTSLLTTRVRASLGAPLAGSGDAPSLVRNRVIAASDALEGWRSTELFQPGTVPLVLQATATYAPPGWRARATAKLAMLVRVSDADLPQDVDTKPVGVATHAGVDAGWRPRHWLCVGAGVSATVIAARAVEAMRDVGRSGRAQLDAVPQVELLFGRATVTLDMLVALAGPVDGAGLGVGFTWRQ